MPDFVADDDGLTTAERVLLSELEARNVRFILVGMGAAVLQGADIATQDLDLWLESLDAPEISEAAVAAGGFYAARMQPPMIGGKGLERIDLVTHCHGLDPFDLEYPRTTTVAVGRLTLRLLSLERIIVSKTAADRPKDRAAMEQLRAALAVNKELSRGK